jgi:hypothetical protein
VSIPPTLTVGAGLQTGTVPFCCVLAATLNASEHGGVKVRITSSNPSVALVSPDATTAGTDAIEVDVPQGQVTAPYFVQGVEGATGTVSFTATAPGFAQGTGTVSVVAPAVQLQSLPTSTTATAANIDFQVLVGLPDGSNGFIFFPMPVRAQHTLTLTVTNSNATAARLVTQAGNGQSRQVTISAGNSVSPTGVASGGIAFDPLAAGTTTVTVATAGVTTTAAGTVIVDVGAGLAPQQKGKKKK